MRIEGPGSAGGTGKDRYAELARLLRARRDELGLSRREVTEATGLSYPYISQLEGGYRAPSVSSARRLADALALPVEDLVRAAEGESAPPVSDEEASSTTFMRNPSYAPSTATGIAAASLAAVAVPPPGGYRRQGADRGDSDVARAADDVVRLLGRLPAERRLDALALAQSRLMSLMVHEQVRRATET